MAAGPPLPPLRTGVFLMTSARQLPEPDSASWSWITAAARAVPSPGSPAGPAGFPRTATWPVAHDGGLRPVAAVRASARAMLQRWGITERGDDIILVLSELLANALLHARPGPGRWRVAAGLLQPCQAQGVLCAVTDPGPDWPRPRPGDWLGESGRGLQAQNDLTAAYNAAAATPTTATIPVELGGTTLTPGVYASSAGTFGINGNLTLDAQGDPNAVFIFKAASTLITASASASRVVLVNGAQAANVIWVVGSSATLGTSSLLRGSILAQASITVTTGVTVDGRLLARTAAVTLDTATITAPPSLIIVSAADVASATPGSTVHYMVTVTNTSDLPAAGATFTDALGGVLDDAAYDGDAAATRGVVSFASPSLAWSGSLAAGGSATITFSVTVNNPDNGDGVLSGMITSATPGSNCPIGGTDPRCSSAVAVIPITISLTGLSSSIVLSGLPGTTVHQLHAVTMTVITNSPSGYDVTVQATSSALTALGTTDTIPVSDLLVRESGETAYQPLSGTIPDLIHQQDGPSSPSGDLISNDYEINIPSVLSGTYSTSLTYIATTTP